MCGDCVEGLASTGARASTLCAGAVAFAFRAFFFFFPLPPPCGLLDVFVLGAKVNLKRNKEEGKH